MLGVAVLGGAASPVFGGAGEGGGLALAATSEMAAISAARGFGAEQTPERGELETITTLCGQLAVPVPKKRGPAPRMPVRKSLAAKSEKMMAVARERATQAIT